MIDQQSHEGELKYGQVKFPIKVADSTVKTQMLVDVKVIKLAECAILPTYAHGPDEDAGMDLYSAEDVTLSPEKPTLVGTGLAFQIPSGIEGQIRPRSGLANKHGVAILNSPGTVDPGYRGELKVALTSLFFTYSVKKGDRIAQIVFTPYTKVNLVQTDTLDDTERGAGGFGSSGV